MTVVLQVLGGLGYVSVVSGLIALALGLLSAASLGKLRHESYSDLTPAAPSLTVFWVLARLRRYSAVATLVDSSMLALHVVGSGRLS